MEPFFDMMLLDLGLSSDQLSCRERGFSFLSDTPLDMRMDRTEDFSAADVLNNYRYAKLRSVFRRGGVTLGAEALANAVVRRRPLKKLPRFCESLRSGASPLNPAKKEKSHHPATVPFQAVRIEVNKEFDHLRSFLDQVPRHLRSGGRLAVISFHSLEDKIVTQAMRRWAQAELDNFGEFGLQSRVNGRTPRNLPGGLMADLSGVNQRFGALLTKQAIVPAAEEISRNPRSRSARLRVFERARVNLSGMNSGESRIGGGGMNYQSGNLGVLSGQSVVFRPRVFNRVVQLRFRLIPGIFLFIVLALQLWVRISTIEKGYELEKLRETALKNDVRLRQLRLELAYTARPAELIKRANHELGFVALAPQRIRKLVRKEG